MYSCNDERVLPLMDEERLGTGFCKEGRACEQCGADLDDDDQYRYEDMTLCTACFKDALFDELGEDYRLR